MSRILRLCSFVAPFDSDQGDILQRQLKNQHMPRLLLIAVTSALGGLLFAAGHSDVPDQVDARERALESGIVEITNRCLDAAIEGDGYFQVVDPTTHRFRYTRKGNFAIGSKGLMVIGSADTGLPLQPHLSLPSGAFDPAGLVFSADGRVWIQSIGQAQFLQIGHFRLAKFSNPQGLRKLSENFYQETPSSGAAIFGQPGENGLGWITQNCLERPRSASDK